MRSALQAVAAALVLAACSNTRYPAELVASNTLSTPSTNARPLPGLVSNRQSVHTYRIYEPPYGYLKRPYVLEPRAATEVVKPLYLDHNASTKARATWWPDDFVYNIKRHATTCIEAPVCAVLAEYVVA
jgi:hypothetical protein